MKKASLAALVALMALAVVAVGCGGSDDSETTETLTKAEFIKQGDQICEKANEASEDEAEEFAKENDFTLEKASKAQIEEAISAVLVPNLNGQVEDLRALGTPEGDEDQVEEILVSLEGAADEIEGDPGLLFEGKTLEEPSKLAEDYGFEVCGEA